MMSDEDNATGDVKLLCKLFFCERCSFHYSTEESRVIPGQNPFQHLGLDTIAQRGESDCKNGPWIWFLFATHTHRNGGGSEPPVNWGEEGFHDSFKNINDNGQLQVTFESNAQQLLRADIDQFVARVNKAIRDRKVPQSKKSLSRFQELR